jgi:hypothetical protein
MIKINFSEADLGALQYWRFHHPDPRVQVRMEALYLRSQGVANRDIPRLCGISKASFHHYLRAYATGASSHSSTLSHVGHAASSTHTARRSRPTFSRVRPPPSQRRRPGSKP